MFSLLFFFLEKICFYVYGYMAYRHICVLCMCSACGDQKGVPDHLELKLYIFLCRYGDSNPGLREGWSVPSTAPALVPFFQL